MPCDLDHAFKQAEAILAGAVRPLLIAHTKADGDALGSLLAMRDLLTARGAKPLAMPFEPMPPRYVALRRFDPMPVWGRDIDAAHLADVDAVVVLDTCAYQQIKPLADWLKSTDLPKVVIDHHLTRDALADVYVIDESASAACLVIYEMATALGWPIGPGARDALFVGIATDTGWFRHSNTDARTLHAAAHLLDAGTDVHSLYRMLYQTDSPGRMRLLGSVLSGMELTCDDRLAILSVERGAIDRLGARMSDTEDMINEPLRISTVIVSVLLIEQDDGVVRASFRSKPPLVQTDEQGKPDCAAKQEPSDLTDGQGMSDRAGGQGPTHAHPDIDVAAIAQSLGGGGHRRASGARVRGPVVEARQRIIAAITPLLQA